MSLKEKFSFLSPQGTEAEVAGQKYIFYPMSVRAVFRLRSLMSPLMAAVSVLMSSNPNDCKSTVKETQDGRQDITVEAVPTDTAKLRTEQRKAALKAALETLLDPTNAETLAALLKDAMRDDLGDLEMSQVVELVQETPVAYLTEMLFGVFGANKKVFAPLATKAGGLGSLVSKGMAATGLNSADLTETTEV
jgi:hypothetical protein